ncbi:endolytic transglycosylase MltG [Plantactinospora mayteni]|uniref:Endolytic murein transglycosylase n=1 Tax=Plantactinospora mayteni TaxID=566021 RepID=A0ABQ4EV15_9ACTN|nr:endolytic transglycosylase MltG [Plantactinospora mayteni]GIG98496.1 ABC transporter substrate-binding protein [Plantactinospora mayteni]
MIDELELAFDERAEKGRHRRGAQRKRNGKKKRGGRGRTVAALLMTFVLLGVLGGAGWYGFDRVQGYFVTPDYDGGGSGEVQVQVEQGQSIADIANTLVAAGVVKSTKAFIEAAQENSRSQNIQPGVYKVRKEMNAKAALGLLLDLKNKLVNGFLVKEGATAKQIFKALAADTKLPVKDFETAAKDLEGLGIADFWFKRDDKQSVRKSIEGFLFPDTYELPPNATAEAILKLMVQRFLSVAEDIDFVDRVQKEREISPYEALIVASLAQAEAGNADDLGKVARVAYNRIYSGDHYCKNGNGLTGCLEFDVGVNYYWELTGKKTKRSGDMTDAELFDTKNPYRMHGKAGLPPGPINNPGQKALEGAMNPPPGKWLFFVAVDKEGHSEFAETNEQHERNKQKARENGVL